MRKARLTALVTACSETFMKSSSPQYCLASILFGIAEVELNLKAQAVEIDDLLSRKAQIGAEQQDMSAFGGVQVGFNNDDQVERVSKLLVQDGELVGE